MLYMFLGMTSAAGAMAGMTGMTGMTGMAGMPGMSAGSSSMLMLSDPTLAFVFAAVLIGYSVWDLDQLSGRRYSLTSAPVALAVVRAGVPAMAGAPGSGDAGGQAVARDATAVGERNVAGGALGQFLLSPAVTIGCRVTMGVVMTMMLLIAI
jgi:hypothetical protein